MPRVGGVVPDSYGLSLTVTVPTASEANPVEADELLTFATTGPYQAQKATAGSTIILKAKHPVRDGLTPLGVHVYGFSRVDRFGYSGAAPAIGASIESAGDGTVRTAATGNGSFVLYVDATRNYVEVAMP
ncbi:hypothetical protein COJ96_10885 [Bacillus sp. AFS073361]|uniref:hypothetical protein n=1 Tax=Bacillus sp. AFS073361 TaxID=2033511 RepID=UPI000BF5641C|nr:hypothetical protein [Bacillus sp. AFS073361]PFP29401.1 hypothetical protein COJ96_10885 [Bacillus sp. AFS073361]